MLHDIVVYNVRLLCGDKTYKKSPTHSELIEFHVTGAFINANKLICTRIGNADSL